MVGLENLGSTCYLNTLLEILSKIPGISEQLESAASHEEDEESFTMCLYVVLELINKSNPNVIVSPRRLYSKIVEEDREYLGECDVEELMICMFDWISKEIGENEHNFIEKYFTGEECCKKICIACGKIESKSKEEFLTIGLDVNESIEEWLNEESPQFQDECTTCGKETPMNIIESSYKMPENLIVHYNRFEALPNGTIIKDNEKIEIQQELIIQNQKNCSVVYGLVGIAHHIGNTDSGHYFADIKTENGWVRADDENLEPTTEETDSQTAYVLVYSQQ